MRVAFTRIYEIDNSLIEAYLSNEGYLPIEMGKQEKMRAAIAIAEDYFSDEMPEFVENPKDFASVEIIN